MTEDLKLAEEFNRQRLIYEAFTENAYAVVTKLIEVSGPEIASIEWRTKSFESLRDKIERGDKIGKYKSLQDVTDLSGLRVISFLKEDCTKLSQLLRNAFVVDEENSVIKQDEADADRFGYQSIHLILSYNKERLKLPEFHRFAGFKFEVQIKTLLQHTWSAIDWKLRYKRSSSAPKKLRRRLFRISALLDAADDELSYVYQQVSDIKSYYAGAIDRGDLALEVDLESVDALLTRRADLIEKLATKFEPVPKLNQTEEQEIRGAGQLLTCVKLSEITELGQLDARIRNIGDGNLAKFQTAVTDWLAEVKSSSWSTNKYDLTRIAILLTASKPEAAKMLAGAAFNPVLTAKVRVKLEIEEPPPASESKLST